MKFCKTAFILSLYALLAVPAIHATEAETKRIEEDIRRNYDALFNKDYDTVLSYTNPKILELAGGKDKLKPMIAKTMEVLTRENVLSYDINPPFTFIDSEAWRYAIAPTVMVMKINGVTVKSTGYQLGQYNADEDRWTYIDGSGLNPAVVKMLFPDFPASASLPEVKVEVQEQEN